MGCGKSKNGQAPAGGRNDAPKAKAPAQPRPVSVRDNDSPPCGPIEEKVRSHPDVRLMRRSGEEYYALSQAFAIVRHGDRLDHTPDWKSFKDRPKWPNDTPLTELGHTHATEVGKRLKKSGKPFGLIVSSPYYRCAQTASRIAQVLQLPIHFDLDLGEVFDNVSMKGNIGNKEQHRQPKDLEAQLKPDFPGVQYIRDAKGLLKVEGKLQRFPEDFDAARMRYCYKVKKLLQKAASELMSIVIVTHGDALASVIGLLRQDWQIMDVPYTANAICSRDVKVLQRNSESIVTEEPVYVHPEEWKLDLSAGFKYKEARSKQASEMAEKEHANEMRQMNAQAAIIKTEYQLDDEQVQQFRQALADLDAHPGDTEHLMVKATSCHHLANDRSSRVLCSPHSKEEPELGSTKHSL